MITLTEYEVGHDTEIVMEGIIQCMAVVFRLGNGDWIGGHFPPQTYSDRGEAMIEKMAELLKKSGSKAAAMYVIVGDKGQFDYGEDLGEIELPMSEKQIAGGCRVFLERNGTEKCFYPTRVERSNYLFSKNGEVWHTYDNAPWKTESSSVKRWSYKSGEEKQILSKITLKNDGKWNKVDF
jgi:hypothetical protein